MVFYSSNQGKNGKNISFGVFSKFLLLFEDFIGQFWFLLL
jgi:hypothetical protein